MTEYEYRRWIEAARVSSDVRDRLVSALLVLNDAEGLVPDHV